jgi:hypothetical protein
MQSSVLFDHWCIRMLTTVQDRTRPSSLNRKLGAGGHTPQWISGTIEVGQIRSGFPLPPPPRVPFTSYKVESIQPSP